MLENFNVRTTLFSGLIFSLALFAFCAGCGSSDTNADRLSPPTPDMVAANATMEALAGSEEQLTEVRNASATIVAESKAAAAAVSLQAEFGPSTAGATVGIAGQKVTLPSDVFVVDVIRYSWGEHGSDLPRWVFGKGDSTIGVAQETGKFSREYLIDAPSDHFDELRRVVEEMTR